MSGPASRPPSIRSVASNSSLASSLSRRPRTQRTRSRTVTGTVSRAEDVVEDLPIFNGTLLQELQASSPIEASSSSSGAQPRPPRSPLRQDTWHSSTAVSSLNLDSKPGDETVVVAEIPIQDDSIMPKPTEPRSYKPPPSAFSPAFTPNVRDSVSTDQSGFSSSLYPASTITDSPPTPTFTQPLEYLNAPVHPTVKDVQSYEGDDVAYRLQLLVKNSYFLPPAHSKPSAADFAALNPAPASKKQSKASAPAFLDLFRSTKPKSKPSTPTGSPNPDAPLPVLRTTAESITTAHLLRPQPTQRASNNPPPSPRLSPQPSRGRVVVVREKMDDLLAAAKQAEQDLKSKGVEIPSRPPVIIADDVIDPTDAVDLPPPSPGYPFPVQASALHGLGVQDSLGAALLADKLVPSKSPNTSSFLDSDAGWRQALLHQAVHHSLDNTPDASMFSTPIRASTPVLSPRRRSKSQAPSPTSSRELLKSGFTGSVPSSPIIPKRASASQNGHERPGTMLLDISQDTSLPSSILPARVPTPVGPLTPLGPPPRQYRSNKPSPNSQATTDEPSEPRRSHSSASHHTLRKTKSSPGISDQESIAREYVMTPPPPAPNPGNRIPSQGTVQSYDTLGRTRAHGTLTAASFYSEFDDYEDSGRPRNSFAMSVMSDYSQASPTTSAFQEALNHHGPYASGHSSLHGSLLNLNTTREPLRRISTTSPPPRLSSSIAHTALAPAPRRGNHHPYAHPFNQPPASSSSVRLEDTFELTEPEPASPHIPLQNGRDSVMSTLSLGMTRPSTKADPASSRPSFFDSIPNAMDDLESSTDDDSETEDPHPLPSSVSRVNLSTESRGRSASVPDKLPLTRYGNHSAPYINRSRNSSEDRLQPVGNIAPKPQFFSERKSDNGHPMPAYNFNRSSHEDTLHAYGGSGRPETSKSVPPVHSGWRSQDTRKLDDLLKQHLETEKDTIKRIATTAKQSSVPPPPAHSRLPP